MAATALAQAINQGLRRALDADSDVVLMGEDIGKLGGVFRVTEGLQQPGRCGRNCRQLAEYGVTVINEDGRRGR